VLIVITVPNLHKPGGITPHGQHKQTKELKGSTKNAQPLLDGRLKIQHRGPADVGLLSRDEDLMSRREIETALGVLCWAELAQVLGAAGP
jgi:hypothetical protein